MPPRAGAGATSSSRRLRGPSRRRSSAARSPRSPPRAAATRSTGSWRPGGWPTSSASIRRGSRRARRRRCGISRAARPATSRAPRASSTSSSAARSSWRGASGRGRTRARYSTASTRAEPRLPLAGPPGMLSAHVLNVSGIAKRYGGQVVLDDVTWGVPDGARVGLTGPNGAGKSTLLRIIAGEVEPDRGTVALPRGARVGYLPQHILGTRGVTVHRHAPAAFADLPELEARRASLEPALATVARESAECPAVRARYRAGCEG